MGNSHKFNRYHIKGDSPVKVQSRGQDYGVWEVVDSYETEGNGVVASMFGGASLSIAGIVCEALNNNKNREPLRAGMDYARAQIDAQYLVVICNEGLKEAGFRAAY